MREHINLDEFKIHKDKPIGGISEKPIDALKPLAKPEGKDRKNMTRQDWKPVGELTAIDDKPLERRIPVKERKEIVEEKQYRDSNPEPFERDLRPPAIRVDVKCDRCENYVNIYESEYQSCLVYDKESGDKSYTCNRCASRGASKRNP